MAATTCIRFGMLLPAAALCAISWVGTAALAAMPGTDQDDIQWSEKAALAPHSLLLDVAEAGDRIIAVGERGHILVSKNGGLDWQQARVPVRTMLTAVAAVESKVWTVGHDAAILHSADAGNTWRRQHYAPEARAPLLDVWFENARRGLAVGAYGLALATADGGANWEPIDIDPDQERHLNAIAAAADGTLFIAAEAGMVFRSRNGGHRWEALNTPYAGSFFGALPPTDGSILVFGLRGHMYRSTDGGDAWKPVPTGSDATLLGGTVLENGSVMIVGLSGAVLVSDNGGERFTARNRPDRLGLAAALPLESDRILLVGEGGLMRVPRTDLGVQP